MSISILLQGGLGNQLFQLAFLEYVSLFSNKIPYLNTLKSPTTVHSSQEYFTTIFQNWKPWFNPQSSSTILRENSKLAYECWIPRLQTNTNMLQLHGYFQRFEYTDPIREQFISRLTFNTSILDKYPFIKESFFIHIRGGDYKNNAFHEVKLQDYYRECIHRCKGEKFVVFTNDIDHVETLLGNNPYTIIKTNEVDTLYLMSQCKGGICANSSFSWWGAYLNPKRRLFFPDTWFNDSSMDTTGLYFPGCTKVSVTSLFNFVNKIVYINLDHRTDRRASIEKQFESINSDKLIRFSAICEPHKGHLGCAKSHVEVLKMAIQHNWDNVLILEDDAVLNKFDIAYPIFKNLTQQPYDCIVLGGADPKFDNKSFRLSSCACTTAYFIHKRYYKKLLDTFSESVKYLTVTYNHQKYAIDQMWKTLMKTDAWYITAPSLFIQMSDYSDIEGRILNKEHLFA